MIDYNSNFNIQVAAEPVRNMIYSLLLIEKTKVLSGLNHWPIDVSNALTPEEKKRHRLVIEGFYFTITPEKNWTSFPSYVDFLRGKRAEAIRDRLILEYIDKSEKGLQGVDEEFKLSEDTVDIDAVLESEESYIRFLQSVIYEGTALDEDLEREAYSYLVMPQALKSMIVDHLSMIWDRFLAEEWVKVERIVIDSVNAFNQIDFTGMDIYEVVKKITDKDFTHIFKGHTIRKMEKISRYVFIPSPHVGPYMNKLIQGKTMWIFFGARLPEGIRFEAPALDHQEIVTKLSAISDRTRLTILKHIASVGERSSGQIIKDLNLSQSAASRHLKQLSATGLLDERRVQNGKFYRINKEKIKNIFKSVINYLIVDS